MIFKQIEVGGMLNFAYILGDKESGEGLVIDPSWEPERLFNIANGEGLAIKYIINTHCHEDHVNGNAKMKELTGALVAIHEDEAKYLRHFFPPEADVRLRDKEVINLGKVNVTVMHTPGHSPGSICLMAEDRLFTGDTLFVGSCGRTDLPGGDGYEFKKTMQRLRNLDDSVVIYPGHNYGDTMVSTIGREKQYNPCLLTS